MKYLYTITLLLCIVYPPVCSQAATRMSLADKIYRPMDDEYEKYKKKADDFFKEGRYTEASRQYANCFEVPGFEKDTYAKTKIDECNQCISLRQRAEAALTAGNGVEAIRLRQQILAINPADPITKSQLTDYWSDQGNTLYGQKKYAEAKDAYAEALKYATKKDLLTIQIQNSEQFLKQQQAALPPKEEPKPVVKQEQSRPNPVAEPQKSVAAPTTKPVPEQTKTSLVAAPRQFTPRRTGLKVAIGTIGVGAGIYAFMLNSQFKSKLNTLNDINLATDPDGDGVIVSQADYNQWQKAYDEAETARNKNGLFKACVGIAAVAVLADVYLLVKKPKAVRKGMSWRPASNGVGLAARYTF